MWPFSSNNSSQPNLDPELAQYAKDAVKQQETAEAPAPAVRKREIATNSRAKSIGQIAMDNCVEYERAYSSCLRTGTYMDRFTSCQSQQQMHEKCVELQNAALEVLGYAVAPTDNERAQIKARADDIMIATIPTLTISKEQVAAFEQELGKIEPRQTRGLQVTRESQMGR